MEEENIVLEKSQTSATTKAQGKECILGKFVTEADGWKIVEAAKEWEGTPYRLVGSNSVKGIGGDCSGTTNKSYIAAGFPYPYQSTANFVNYVKKSFRFGKIHPDKQALQPGDILLWPGHMAIYAPFPVGDSRRSTGVILRGQKMNNDMYTAFNSHSSTPYGPYNIQTFRRDAFSVYRYFIVTGSENCTS
jgi:hypothetical protein